jgi:hypothetical protein
VECGSLLPLFSSEACLARSEAFAAFEEHVPASRDGRQRRQAAALHTGGDGSTRPTLQIGKSALKPHIDALFRF